MDENEVILGVDTHLDTHVGVLISTNGNLLGCLAVTTDTSGYLKLVTWANSFGMLKRAGVEGTGTYGAGLARVLRDHGIEVLEVNRPDRSKRRLQEIRSHRRRERGSIRSFGKRHGDRQDPIGCGRGDAGGFGCSAQRSQSENPSDQSIESLARQCPARHS